MEDCDSDSSTEKDHDHDRWTVTVGQLDSGKTVTVTVGWLMEDSDSLTVEQWKTMIMTGVQVGSDSWIFEQ